MKEDKNVFKRFQNSFAKLDGRLHILEQRVPVEKQMEYFRYSGIMRKDPNRSEIDYEIIQETLADPEASAGQKRHVLTMLATTSEVRAYRMLEEYVQAPDSEIADWAYMALMECRIGLESEFSDEKQIYISTGLGGKGEKLRFYVLMVANKKEPFKTYERDIVEREFPYLLAQSECDVERLTVGEKYIELLFLVPVRAEIKLILDQVVNECNQYGDFISSVYTVTNVKELSEEEIQEVIEKHEKSNQTSH
ncbi:MAG: hypothetical protein Q4A54_14150 [Parabacteroides sp.]|nr:hypothetical protein [Parabacteroides sp.]